MNENECKKWALIHEIRTLALAFPLFFKTEPLSSYVESLAS